jgi:hypothetical protein
MKTNTTVSESTKSVENDTKLRSETQGMLWRSFHYVWQAFSSTLSPPRNKSSASKYLKIICCGCCSRLRNCRGFSSQFKHASCIDCSCGGTGHFLQGRRWSDAFGWTTVSYMDACLDAYCSCSSLLLHLMQARRRWKSSCKSWLQRCISYINRIVVLEKATQDATAVCKPHQEMSRLL